MSLSYSVILPAQKEKCGFSSWRPDVPELNQKQKVIDDFERATD